MTTTRRREFNRRMIASIAWFASFLAAGYVYWLVMSNFVVRNFWDPVYAKRIELLKARLAEKPGRPLWLVMGSSHVHEGLSPEALEERIQDGKSPLLFNFGSNGADLFYQLICLRRLLKDGIRPARVGIEFDTLLNGDYPIFVGDPGLVPRARMDEVDEYAGYSSNSRNLRSVWLQSRWNPFFDHGMKVPDQTLTLRLFPPLSLFEKQTDNSKWGWNEISIGHPSKEVLDIMIRKIAPYIAEHARNPVPPNADRALRELIALCGKQGISLFLIRMPEAEGVRVDYPEQAQTVTQNYIGKIRRDYGTQVIDARAWATDDDFFDPHHLNSAGAKKFTRKLAEVLYADGQE